MISQHGLRTVRTIVMCTVLEKKSVELFIVMYIITPSLPGLYRDRTREHKRLPQMRPDFCYGGVCTMQYTAWLGDDVNGVFGWRMQ